TSDILRNELARGLRGLLCKDIFVTKSTSKKKVIVISARRQTAMKMPDLDGALERLGPDGFVIHSFGSSIAIVANTDKGLLYGAFRFLRLMQTRQQVAQLDIVTRPSIRYRLLNHWDNLDRSVERGYAGKSLWKWNELPDRIDPRYHDYARANASLGINGVVLNNVNANPAILKTEYLKKVAALANVFRPYGIRVFLSANFASPISAKWEQEGNRKAGIGNLPTADPLNPDVRKWWKKKVEEIYSLIPDFGGFLVKASSEGMSGPQDFGRTHAQGANMLAEALAPFGGIVMWRGFVYDPDVDPDRVKRSYKEFVPLDRLFGSNVFVQAKNGPLDFQPREPVQPLFGAMAHTPLMLELQITQEYLGHSTHLVYLAPMWKEYFEFDTYAKGKGSTLASIIDGTTHNYRMTGIAGVTNIGDDRNWCGHFFAQANWFAYGRLAWNPTLPADEIADDWIRMSIANDSSVVRTIRDMMMGSWEACINYMTPLGLHHIMQEGFHYGPEPQHDTGRVDWRSTYYHRADSVGLGFNRSSTGSSATAQYFPPLDETFDNPATCPEKYLLWFHHVRWDYRMQSGRTLWEELCTKYYAGADYVNGMTRTWSSLESKVDPMIFAHVESKLEKQIVDALVWRDTCLNYFQKFSGKPIYKP
ncbi:MAG: alpha-glucuronidase, partial [Ignavibacteriae bacterium]|nr:alpha-glucuronidase [Ignavibacteriota bacterium]